METRLKMKAAFNRHRQELPSLHRAINRGDGEVIRRTIETHYEHLRLIYKLTTDGNGNKGI
jgi:hypothetical protein